jgi:Icc-related predicted phosphoesterase
VGDVGAVETLALLNQRFGPQHLLDRREFDRPLEDASGGGVLEPVLVDAREAGAGAVDDVDEVLAAVRLAEPVRKRHVGREAGSIEGAKSGVEVGRANEDVEVLGVTLDPGVGGKGVGAADEDVETRMPQRIQGAAIEGFLLALEPGWLSRHGWSTGGCMGSTRRAGSTWRGACWGGVGSGTPLAARQLFEVTELVRIAAVGDVHCTKTSEGTLQALFAQMVERAGVIALAGDLVDHGLPEEAQVLVREIGVALIASVPVVAVLGNHDFEGGQPDAVQQILCEAGITVLDGDAIEIKGVGFSGVKGFCGGFGRRSLEPSGEPAIKSFVREAIDEALKLESALARLRTTHRIALMHYSPIAATVEGEPLEIYPFLGSSRLEEPINCYQVDAVLHGHAHHGAPEGRTSAQVPVYNVSMPLLKRHFADRPAFRVLEVERTAPESASAEPPRGAALTDRIGAAATA